MRIVFDSNVLLAVLLFPGGRASAAMENILDGVDNLVLSPPIIREVLSVLARKFSRDREELSRVAVVLGEMGEIGTPFRRLSVFQDDPDNRIPECAVEGKAEAIVTGGKAMLAIGEYEGVRLSPWQNFRPGGVRGTDAQGSSEGVVGRAPGNASAISVGNILEMRNTINVKTCKSV